MEDFNHMGEVRRKLHVTWADPATEARLADVVGSASAWLAARLGYPRPHVFSPDDGEAWQLFLNACLYEFSDALDDFSVNYAADIGAARSFVQAEIEAASEEEALEGEDAEA